MVCSLPPWARLLECLELRADDYTPYGIRRGGATWYFLETASLDATLSRGRWATTKTARSYVDAYPGPTAVVSGTKTRRQALHAQKSPPMGVCLPAVVSEDVQLRRASNLGSGITFLFAPAQIPTLTSLVSGWFLSHVAGLLRLTGCQVPPLEVGALVVSGVAMSH